MSTQQFPLSKEETKALSLLVKQGIYRTLACDGLLSKSQLEYLLQTAENINLIR